MKKIEIKPNSGTELAGVKVRKHRWGLDCWVEIKYVGKQTLIGTNEAGLEYLYSTDSWYLYEEPKNRQAFAAWRPCKDPQWVMSTLTFSSYENAFDFLSIGWAKGTIDVIWPVRFDDEGYLIIPERE